MEVQEVEAEVRRLAQLWFEEKARAEAATRRANGLWGVIQSYVSMFPELEDLPLTLEIPLGDPIPVYVETPRGAEAVRVILHEHPGQEFRVSELLDALRLRGWVPESDNPANAVRTALERLVSSPEADVVKHRYTQNVTYSYEPDRDRDRYEEEPF